MSTIVVGGWPCNELGEVVMEQGTGTTSVTGFLNGDKNPVSDSTGKFVVRFPDITADVLDSPITGFVAGAGAVSAADTILQAFNKLDGNVTLKAPAASPTLTGITDTEARQVQVREIAAAGAITMLATDDVILVNKTVGAASAVALTAGTTGRRVTIKDKKKDAVTNNITITPNGAETIDGVATLVLNVNAQSATLVFNGTDWSVI